MIEDKVQDFLSAKLSVPVYMEIPQNPPVKMIVLEKTGGGLESKVINTSVIAAKSYGKSLYDAAELNDEVKAAVLDGIDGLITLDDVLKVELNSDYNFTDTTTKKYRYQAIFIVTHY